MPRRSALAGWDEFFDPDTGATAYRSSAQHARESAARTLQRLARTKKRLPLPPLAPPGEPSAFAWASAAYTFEPPAEVRAELRARGGWGALRRRGLATGRRVRDDLEQRWVEQRDPVSGDLFYTEEAPMRGWSA